jgi:hypothetical protein
MEWNRINGENISNNTPSPSVYDGYLHYVCALCAATLIPMCACMDTLCASAWIPDVPLPGYPCVPLHVYHVTL